MKRSELVQKYTDILKMYGYIDNELMSAEGLATVLLGVAENNGMLPPTRDMGRSEEKINKWKPENEI